MTDLQIQRMLQQATGLNLSTAAIETAIRKRMKQRHICSRSAYSTNVLNWKEELDALIDLVVVPETWFFRDLAAFSIAARCAVELLSSSRHTVRILSAPCASGEEPYSLAISMLEAGLAPANFIIDGVDVSPHAIHLAERGVYQRNAFRNSEANFRNQYFVQCNDGFELTADIRQLVQFRCRNLLTLDPLDGIAYDIIFCRNLLIYFDEATQATAIDKLRSLLNNDGLLFCGYAEALTFCLRGFARAPLSHAFALRKKSDMRNSCEADIPHAAVCVRQPARAVATVPMPAVFPQPTEAPKTLPAQESPDALLERANRIANQGILDEAINAYSAYLELVPDSAQAYFMLGLLNEQRDEDKSAEEFFRRAVYLDPNHYEALCHLALLLERQGNGANARAYRQRAARVFERRSGGYER